VAPVIVERGDGDVKPGDIAARLEWEPRRLNPALTWLESRGMIEGVEVLNSVPWAYIRVRANARTRRLVRGTL
jgi:hypothetical protein